MGRADTPTLLPIDRYAELMQINPCHFNQLAGPKAPVRSGCDDVWDQTAREQLAWTMAQAEEMIARELGYWPAPKFITEEILPLGLTGVRSSWQDAELRTEWGYVDEFGTELLTLVQANATVVYSDADNDPLDREELATIGTALYADLPACARPCDVAVFFRVADGAVDAADPLYEIRPIKVDIDGVTMRITAESSLFVKPTLWDLTQADCAGSGEPNAWKYNFSTGVDTLVQAVDVYCRTVHPATPATLRWDGVCSCASSPCAHSTQTACAYVTDKKHGFFIARPATWNGTSNIEASPTYWHAPESVEVAYRAGYPLTGRYCRMNPELERAIVKLTNALLPEPPCGYCDAAQQRWDQDRKDVDPLTPEAAALPWDLYKRGALDAWRVVKKMAMGRGGKLGRR